MKRIVVNKGDRYGHLSVISEVESQRIGGQIKRMIKCQCDCGNITILELGKLQSGHTISCGCYRQTANRERSQTHGLTHSRIFNIWSSMRQRCCNSNRPGYKHYGGRGIKVCEEWNVFETFYEWAIKNGYDESLTLDRIDTNGNYEPNNCRWTTWKVQQNNRRNNRLVEINGVVRTLQQWADISGIRQSTILCRLNRGVLGECLVTPANIASNGYKLNEIKEK